jgi:2-polyprenyl-3-methyl-5-hydroxy-6-metoxy-1,4-benzoquinol methylase
MNIENIYKEKGHESYFSTVRKEVVPLLPATSRKILEIGCGEGATLGYLKRRGIAKWTCGIDVHDAALQKARENGVDETILGNIEDSLLVNRDDRFDVILCLDVLEHLVDPWSVVERISDLLADGGIIIVSIPNVQHLRVIVPLIFGRWTYQDCGILDKGHLRFFTRRSAVELMRSGGLTVDRITQIRESHWLLKIINVLSLGLFSRLITVQYLIRVKVEDETRI